MATPASATFSPDEAQVLRDVWALYFGSQAVYDDQDASLPAVRFLYDMLKPGAAVHDAVSARDILTGPSVHICAEDMLHKLPTQDFLQALQYVVARRVAPRSRGFPSPTHPTGLPTRQRGTAQPLIHSPLTDSSQ